MTRLKQWSLSRNPVMGTWVWYLFRHGRNGQKDFSVRPCNLMDTDRIAGALVRALIHGNYGHRHCKLMYTSDMNGSILLLTGFWRIEATSPKEFDAVQEALKVETYLELATHTALTQHSGNSSRTDQPWWLFEFGTLAGQVPDDQRMTSDYINDMLLVGGAQGAILL